MGCLVLCATLQNPIPRARAYCDAREPRIVIGPRNFGHALKVCPTQMSYRRTGGMHSRFSPMDQSYQYEYEYEYRTQRHGGPMGMVDCKRRVPYRTVPYLVPHRRYKPLMHGTAVAVRTTSTYRTSSHYDASLLSFPNRVCVHVPFGGFRPTGT